MTETFNVYCDESGHLEHDKVGVMVLGAVWCPLDKTGQISERLREIKQKHGLSRDLEVKWGKVSPARTNFYLDLIDYFFDDDDLHFRALVVPNKALLRHGKFAQDHDDWYYKMYFDMLKVILHPTRYYRIYLDIKDTQSEEKVRHLRQVLSNSMYDFSMRIVERIQQVRSNEVELVQLADLLIGAVSYANREMSTSPAKLVLVNRIRSRSGYRLDRSTLYQESKVNVFVWRAQELDE